MEIPVRAADPSQRKPRPTDESKLGFGVYFSDHIFLMDYAPDLGWHAPRIEPYGPLPLDPASLVLHYAQQVFEGMKAFRRVDGGLQLFRPRSYLGRLNGAVHRLCMPTLDVEFTLQALKQLVTLDKDWVPRAPGSSLYIRPVMLATEPAVGVKSSQSFLFYILIGPVGPYYPEGFNPTKIYVTDHYVRAVRGGIGGVKTSGNYAASLLAAQEAHEKGYTQVLWLDAVERAYVEEVGTSNIFFRMEDGLVTPPLTGSIIPGITRDSVLQLARDWGLPVEERPISIDEVIEGISSARLHEMFATGTAAVISPVGEICYKDKVYTVSEGRVGDLSRRLYDELTGIQYGERPDPYGWIEPIV